MKFFISLLHMGQKRKTRLSSDTLLETVSRILVPDYILENFDIYGAQEFSSCWVIELREKEGLIPVELKRILHQENKCW